ncbi:MAG: hypothetical protein AAFR98_12115 [Pseudomonadota bacterium]
MQSIQLNDRQVTAIRGALELARDKYVENASTLRQIPNHERLAEQFDRQAKEADDLLEQIDY